MRFTKMQGAGNDYIYVDCFREPPAIDEDQLPELARRMSDRRFGVGGDGLILIRPSEKADARMQMFNADGSEAEMCGNGIRCLAKYVYDHGLCPKESLAIDTGAGRLELELRVRAGKVEQVRVDMGEPILDAARIPTVFERSPVVHQPLEVAGHELLVTCVSMGNPHCIVFVEEPTDELVLGLGPKIERDAHFPARVNVEFVKVESRRVLHQRTWERGSGETWACGTGASAVGVAGVLAGLTDRQVLVHLRGGDLEIDWSNVNQHVYMTGPAVEVFSGEWQL